MKKRMSGLKLILALCLSTIFLWGTASFQPPVFGADDAPSKKEKKKKGGQKKKGEELKMGDGGTGSGGQTSQSSPSSKTKTMTQPGLKSSGPTSPPPAGDWKMDDKKGKKGKVGGKFKLGSKEEKF